MDIIPIHWSTVFFVVVFFFWILAIISSHGDYILQCLLLGKQLSEEVRSIGLTGVSAYTCGYCSGLK